LLTGLAGAAVSIISPLAKVDASTWVPIAVTLLGGAAIVLAAVAISVALFVKGDLEARGVASAARHEGRAAVAREFLRATAAAPSRAVPTATTDTDLSESDRLLVAIAAYGPGNIFADVPSETITKGTVTGIKRLADGMRIHVNRKDWVPLDKVTTFQSK
jgi:hypothetical protein